MKVIRWTGGLASEVFRFWFSTNFLASGIDMISSLKLSFIPEENNANPVGERDQLTISYITIINHHKQTSILVTLKLDFLLNKI